MDIIYEFLVYIFYVLQVCIEIFKNVLGIRRRYQGNARLDGKVVIITGANTGIGKRTALHLSLRGAKIIIGCRDLDKGQRAVQEIKMKNAKADITVLRLDLSAFRSIRHFAQSVAEQTSKVDILINNAGVMACPELITEDGFELQFGTNHLGHFLLTLALLPYLSNSSKARVITVSSVIHMKGKIHFENINLRHGLYNPTEAYCQSKLANVLFCRELAKRLGPQSNITTYCLHPGIIRSDLWRHQSTNVFNSFIRKFIFINTELGSQTTLYCALEESLDNETGFYYNDCKRVDERSMVWRARDDRSAHQLWEMSTDLVKLEENLRLGPN